MSHTPKLTMMGLYNYNSNVFEKLVLPSEIDKNTFIMSFLMQYGERPVIYTNYDFMKEVIGVWSKKWYHSIERIILAINDEYNPLHNFDRHEEYNDEIITSETNEIKNTENANDQRNLRSTSNEDRTTNTTINETNTGENHIENTVSAFNASTYQPDNKQDTNNSNELEHNESQIMSDDIEYQESESETNDITRKTDGKSNEDKLSSHSGHLYGNIGVTKSQDMLIDEIKVRKNYNLYDIVSELLYREICIYTY